MKRQDYMTGEKKLSAEKFPQNNAFGILWPMNRVIKGTSGKWLDIDKKVMHNRVINQIAESITRIALEYVDTFHEDSRLSIDLIQRIASITCKDRDMIFQFQLIGDNINSEIFEELSECIRFLGENLMNCQEELDFNQISFKFEEDKKQFLIECINELRKDFSGRDIQQPFGLESCGHNRHVASFRHRFDIYKGTPLPPKPLKGKAIVDGFRDSDNTVFLKMLNKKNELEEKSRPYLVSSAALIELAILARRQRKHVEFRGQELYSIGAKKPTLQLENLSITNISPKARSV